MTQIQREHNASVDGEPPLALFGFVRVYFDVILGVIGAAGVLAAVTMLFGWVIALLIGSVALIALALVVPEWD